MSKTICFFLLLLPFIAFSQNDTTHKILNSIWINDKEDTQIQFYEKNGKFFAKVVSIKINEKDKDDLKKQERVKAMKGHSIIRNLTFSNGKYIDGELNIPNKGKVANCSVE